MTWMSGVQDQQCAIAVANLAHPGEITLRRRDASGGGADHRLCQEGHHRFGSDALELRVQLLDQPVDILRVGLRVVLETIREAR